MGETREFAWSCATKMGQFNETRMQQEEHLCFLQIIVDGEVVIHRLKVVLILEWLGWLVYR